MIRPAEHAGLEERAVDDELTTPGKKIEQARLALRAAELVRLVDSHPWHTPTLCSQRVMGAHHGLLLREKLLTRSVPVLLGYDLGNIHRSSPICWVKGWRSAVAPSLQIALSGRNAPVIFGFEAGKPVPEGPRLLAGQARRQHVEMRVPAG